ncbi:MAG: hypothetical protein HY694_05890 [Deltaproteobacteria bacterium]|nr:hypothetical protein [Deltaproteobacteria bacterium]
MQADALKLYEMLKPKLGQEEARSLLTHIDEVHRDTLQQALRGLATKEDLANLRAELLQEIGNVRQEIGKEIGNVRQEIANVRADLLKWMFVFWVGQIAVLSGIFFAMLNFYMKP